MKQMSSGMLSTRWALGAAVLAAGAMVTPAKAADQFIKPTAEELSMTSQAGYPGVPAVILFKEEVTKDDLHVVQHYMRIKILTEKGKEYANVELSFVSSKDDGDYSGDGRTITDIAGRTIHADGTIIPFTGKPYLKTIEKGKSFSYQSRVFTLPDVEVGSIIEYRYSTRINDNVYDPPDWYIQGELYSRATHFVWYPTLKELSTADGGATVNSIVWFPILPPGVQLGRREVPTGAQGGGSQQIYEVTAKDVPPAPDEELMPPIRSSTFRVLFAYSQFRTAAEFWKNEGKRWSKRADSFAGPDSSLRDATQTVTAGADTQDAKLRKIYEAVMGMENTSFTRDRGRNEDKAAGLGAVNDAGDVFKHKRGSSYQLTELFVGMARAAGMKAYVMLVPDRGSRLFTPMYLSMRQFDNVIAIVNVDGKDRFFDPGERYCQYGHLTWPNTMVQGLRQTDNGTDFAVTPGEDYQATKTLRVANLAMNEHGELSGKVTMTYIGATALQWRQRALKGDEESVKDGLRKSLEDRLPKSMEVKVASVDGLTDYEKPLVANFEVKGPMGTPTGKRLILPADFFQADETATFPHDKRETPVYFHYPQSVQDALRISFPTSMSVEAVPTDVKSMFHEVGSYSMTATSDAKSVTIRRNYLFNSVIVPLTEYSDLRTFYSKMETQDKESVVLKMPSSTAPPAGN